MKFLYEILFVSFFFTCSNGQNTELLAPTVQTVRNSLDYSNKILDIGKQNENRFSVLSNRMNSLVDFHKTGVHEHASKIATALRNAKDTYDLMLRNMKKACQFNVDRRKIYEMLKETPLQNRRDFEKELQFRFATLSKMVSSILTATKDARQLVGRIHTELTGVSGDLVYVRETLNQEIARNQAEMRKDEVKDTVINIFAMVSPVAAVSRIVSLSRRIEKLELLARSTNDVKAYVDWLENSTQQLKNLAQDRGLDAADMAGVAEAKSRLMEMLKTFTESDTQNYVLGSVDKAISDIAGMSESFIRKNSYK